MMNLNLLIILAILPFLQTALQNHVPNSDISKVPISPRPLVLVISFDGFRHSYLNPARTPILTKLSATGSTVPYLIPVFPTKTFPNHHSIATGFYSETHGVVDNRFYDSLYDATLDGKKDDPRFWNYDENVLPLWIRNEQERGISGCFMWPGSYYGYGEKSDLFPTYYIPRYNESVSWEIRVHTVISWMTDSNRPANLVFLYYHQPDFAGHRFGPNGQETLYQVEEADKRVGYLLNKLKEAGIHDKINLVLLSDHGMDEVTSEREIDLKAFVDKSLVRTVSGKGGTPVLQIFPNPGENEKLFNALRSGSVGRNFTAFRREDLCGEPYFYCRSSRRIHDFVTLADPGWALRDFSVKQKKRGSVYGQHGYVNTAVSMRAFLISRGPAFKSGYMTEKPVKNVDVVPLLSKVLGLTNVPSNGSLSVVRGMLIEG